MGVIARPGVCVCVCSVHVHVRVCMCTCTSKEAKLQRMGSRIYVERAAPGGEGVAARRVATCRVLAD